MDNILLYMASVPDSLPMLPEVIAQKANIKIERPLVYMMCAKMARDGYLQRNELRRYSLLAEGMFFIEEGGYVEKIKSEGESFELSDTKLRLDISNAKRVYDSYWWTFGMAIAAFGISLFLLVLKLLELSKQSGATS